MVGIGSSWGSQGHLAQNGLQQEHSTQTRMAIWVLVWPSGSSSWIGSCVPIIGETTRLNLIPIEHKVDRGWLLAITGGGATENAAWVKYGRAQHGYLVS